MRKTTMLGKGGGGRTLLAALAVLAVLAAAAVGAVALSDDASHEDADGGAPFYSILGDGGTLGGGPVAKIGDIEYDSLATAIQEAKSYKTIILLDDVIVDTPGDSESAFTIDTKYLTLDLNGKTLRSTDAASSGTGQKLFTIANKGTLVVRDSSADKTGRIDAVCYAIEIVKGSFTLYSGTIQSADMAVKAEAESGPVNVTVNGGEMIGKGSAVISSALGSVTITGGKLTADSESGCALHAEGSSKVRISGGAEISSSNGGALIDVAGSSNIKISDGKFISGGNVIDADGNAVVTVTGGELTTSGAGSSAIVAAGGSAVTIEGGELTADSSDVILVRDEASIAVIGGELTTSNAASVVIGIAEGSSSDDAPRVDIFGGIFINTAASDGIIGKESGNGTITVTGGRFTGDFDEINGYVNDDVSNILEKSDDGSFSVSVKEEKASAVIGDGYYKFTLAHAMSDVRDGETVKLLADIEIETPNANQRTFIIDGKAVVLDLNGMTLESTRGDSDNKYMSLFTIESGGSLTVKDSSGDESGKIDAAWYAICISNGSFTLESGTIQSEGTTVSTTNNSVYGHIVIEDGKLFGKTAAITLNTRGQIDVAGGAIEAGPDLNTAVIILSDTSSKSSDGSAVLNMTGGKVTTLSDKSNKWAIYASAQNTEVNINGGEICGSSALIRADYGGRVNITGGKLTGSSRTVIQMELGTLTISGGELTNNNTTDGSPSVVRIYGKNPSSVAISGGTFENAGKPVKPVIYRQYPDYGSIAISGGTFSSDPTEYIDEVRTKVVESEGTYTVMPVTFDVVFDSDGGSLVDEAIVEYGSTVEMPSAPEKTGYTFTGWMRGDEPYDFNNPVTEDLNLVASWKINQYTLTLVFGNGVEDETITQDYGIAITKPGDPVKTGHTFIGWDSEIPETMPAEDRTITAKWSINQYTLTLAFGNGDEDRAITQEYGTEIPTVDDPVRTGYTFDGWDPGIPETMPAEDMAINAKWMINQYTLTLAFGNGDEDRAITQDYGTAIVAPNDPIRNGYAFGGWDPAVPGTMPAQDLVVTAVWTAKEYKVVFHTVDNYYSQTFTFDAPAELRSAGTRAGHVFDGWAASDGGFVKYTDGQRICVRPYAERIDLYAVWTPAVYSVSVAPAENGTVDVSPNAACGSTVTVTLSPAEGYRVASISAEPAVSFSGDGDVRTFTMPASDVTITAAFAKSLCVVTWKDWDGAVLETDGAVPYGEVPTFDGAVPVREPTAEFSYVFDRWTPDVVAVAGDVTYTAVYTETIRTYTVAWTDWDGEIFETDRDVLYGKMPAYNGAEPARESTAEFDYAFSGWSPEVSAVAGDVTYTAVYAETLRTYTVTWKDGDAVLATEEDVPYGTAVAWKGESAPVREPTAEFKYTFTGWEPILTEGMTVIGDMEFLAQFDSVKRSYDIVFIVDGAETVKAAEYDDMPAYDGVPAKEADVQYTYAFEKWEPEIVAVSGPATYTAVFSETLRTYAVTWTDWDGAVLETDDAAPYGEVPTFDGAIPVREPTAEFSYVFDRWTPEVAAVSGDVTYTAAYTETIRTYTVTWKDSDIILATEEDVPYGAAVAWRGESIPVRESTAEFEYAFAGWNPAVDEGTVVTGDMVFLAQFESVKRSYGIVFIVDGIETVQNAEYGVIPAYDGVPAKEADAQYTYAFDGWEPEITAVSGPATYTAVFKQTVNTYVVTWKDWDGAVLETDEAVPYGAMSTFDGAIPVREPTAEFTYVFDRWTPDVVAVAGDAAYTAVYIEIPASAPEIASIEISTPPEKIAYEIGERFDPAGLAVAGVYADGQRRALSASEYIVDAPVLCRPGDFTVAVRYADLSVEFTVSVIAPEPAHETTENDDGSTTTVSTEVGESEGGTVVVRTETTEHPDGTKTEARSETAYAPDGSVTETSATSSVSADGATSSERTETVKTDASGTEVGRETSVKSSETVKDAAGAIVATVTVESVTRTAGGASESAERVAFEAADDGMDTVVESSDGKARAVTTVRVVDGMVGADLASGAVAQADDALDRLLSPPESVEKTVAVETGAGTSAAFAPEAVKAVAGSGAGLEVSGGGGSIGMGVAICEKLASEAEARIEIVLTHNDDAAVNKVQKDAIDGRHFIDLSAIVDGVKVHDLGGTAVVEFPYELKEGELAENMAIFYIDDSGMKELVDSVYRDGRFTMETDHFSVFVVENTAAVSEPEDEGGDGGSTLLYAGVAAAAVLILVLAVLLLRRRA